MVAAGVAAELGIIAGCIMSIGAPLVAVIVTLIMPNGLG
jgi:hypothetical protein